MLTAREAHRIASMNERNWDSHGEFILDLIEEQALVGSCKLTLSSVYDSADEIHQKLRKLGYTVELELGQGLTISW